MMGKWMRTYYCSLFSLSESIYSPPSMGGVGGGSCKVGRGVYAEDDDEERLYGVDSEGEEYGGLIGDAVEDEHGLDGEMPGTGTVGGGDDDGEGSDAEDEEAGEGADAAGEVEGVEGEVEV